MKIRQQGNVEGMPAETTLNFPKIPMKFRSDLLSVPTPKFKRNSGDLLQISAMLLKKIDTARFRKFPETVMKLKQQHQKFMELYACAVEKEKETEGKPFIKAQEYFYRYRFIDKNDQRLFERLEGRVYSSKHGNRKNY